MGVVEAGAPRGRGGAVEVLLVGVEVPRRKGWAGAAGSGELGWWWCGGRRLGVEGACARVFAKFGNGEADAGRAHM